jgi:hypothetical protein
MENSERVLCTWAALAVGFGLAQPNGSAKSSMRPLPKQGRHSAVVAATPGRRWPGRSRLAGDEEWQGEDQEHEEGALNWLEGLVGKEAHRGRGAGNGDGGLVMGNDRDSSDQRSPGQSGSSTGSPWCLRRTEWGGLSQRRAVGVEVLSWRRRQRIHCGIQRGAPHHGSTRSYKANGEAAWAPARRKLAAVRHNSDGNADRRRGGYRWRPAQRKEAQHSTALEDGLWWNSEEDARSSVGNHGEAVAHNMSSTRKQVKERERR